MKPHSFISHLHLAVSTCLLRKTGLKLVIGTLARLGACSSYYDTHFFEASCIINPTGMNTGDSFIQFVFDNTDHNTHTLSGEGTFHCLEGVAIYTPEQEVSYEGKIKKLSKLPNEETLSAVNTIDVSWLPRLCRDVSDETEFIDTDEYNFEAFRPLPAAYSAFLWAHYYNIKNIPSWKGYMEVLSRDWTSYHVSKIICQPFIKIKATEPTTIYTALVHAVNETKKKKQKTCFVTFDQQLYTKARDIKVNESENVQLVILLGMFHLVMSYLGCLGYIMAGSGLAEMFSVAFGENAVKHLLTGHVFDRAMRAHTLAFVALGKIICESAAENKNEQFKQDTHKFFSNWNSDDAPFLGDCSVDSSIKKMTAAFTNKLHTFKANGPTAALWVQYFKMLMILLQFYEGSRLGNWDLHLKCIKEMLPFFYAARHFNYAKNAQKFICRTRKI